MYIIINSSVDMQLYGLFCCRILKSIFEKAFQFEAMSKIYIATDSLLLWSVSFQNSGIEKAFLFDVISKSYVATDSFVFFPAVYVPGLFQNSGIEKAFLFDVMSKIYIATDSSPVDMQCYELCCDMIDVVMDMSGIYG